MPSPSLYSEALTVGFSPSIRTPDTLRQLLLQRGTLPEAATVRLILNLLDQLTFLEQQGTYLPFLAPEQISLTETGEFRSWLSDSDFSPLLRSVYRAPEQSAGSLPNTQSGIYCVGVLLYEILIGEPPFTGETPASVNMLHRHEALPPLPETFSFSVRETLMRATSKTPSARFQSFGEMRGRLSPVPETKRAQKARRQQEKSNARRSLRHQIGQRLGEAVRFVFRLTLKTSLVVGLVGVIVLSVRSIQQSQDEPTVSNLPVDANKSQRTTGKEPSVDLVGQGAPKDAGKIDSSRELIKPSKEERNRKRNGSSGRKKDDRKRSPGGPTFKRPQKDNPLEPQDIIKPVFPERPPKTTTDNPVTSKSEATGSPPSPTASTPTPTQ